MEFEQGFIDTAQFLGAEILVVHRTAYAVRHGDREGADGLAKIEVRNVAGFQIRKRVGGEQEAAQSRKSQFGTTRISAQLDHHQAKRCEQIRVARAGAALCQPPKPGG